MMLEDFLREVAGDLTYEAGVRREAARILDQWNANIVPSPTQIARLRKMLPQKALCSRLNPDRSCAWLRKHAKEQGLRQPEPGQKVICTRVASGKLADTFQQCPGFRKSKEPA